MNKLLHIVSDYGLGDPAFAEVEQRLRFHYPNFTIVRTAVPAFNTIATGFWIYQLSMGDHPEGMMIYSNTAPRLDKKEKRVKNAGEQLLYAQLVNKVEVIAVNSGYSFSFIKKYIKKFNTLHTENLGSQFRSRDFYPKAVAQVAAANKTTLGGKLAVKSLPDEPKDRIVWVDGYGNIKTSIRKSQVKFKLGSKVRVEIDGVIRTALVSGGGFSVAQGELAFSFGSSGYNDQFVELFLRGGSAYELFGKPSWYATILVTPQN